MEKYISTPIFVYFSVANLKKNFFGSIRSCKSSEQIWDMEHGVVELVYKFDEKSYRECLKR